ncbi:hypothetical protein EKK58_00195 [Candidatus Dependentiae bacterium]|nr:MAG: hypothetical protein EKK58_00195 [Candidatus Dependentiae bacterium]
MLQFKYVAPVHAGDPISSKSHNDLALAFNQRILSGAGDAAWRIMWNAHSLMRQVRNPAGGFGDLPGTQQWPASDEWWKVYALVDNASRCGETNDTWYWPIAEAGQEEGANVANPMMAFVFGRDYINARVRDFEPEVNRLTNGPSDEDGTFEPIDVAVLSGDPFVTASSAWMQAKQQRGIIEVGAPYRAKAPAYEAAHSTYSWRYPARAPYLKTYTTFAPVPKDEGNCPRINGIIPPYWHAKFTPLVPNYPALSFPTCPGVSGHLQYIARLTDRYILYFQDGPTLMLPYTVYLEGPYDGGGALSKQHSELLTQAINKYVIEMRGDYSERLDNGCVDVKGAQQFDFQRFFSSQYALAPAAVGYVDGNGVLQSYGYPTFYLPFSGAGQEQEIPADTYLELSNGHPGDAIDEHYTPPAFVFSAFCITVANTVSAAEFEFVDIAGNPIHIGETLKPCDDGSRAVLSVTVPSAVEGSKTIVKFLGTPVNPGSIGVRLKNAVRMTAGGSITVELLEQVPYIPDIQDAYAVLRCGTTNGSEDGPDTYGGVIASEKLRTLWDYYSKYGCIVNPDGITQLGYHPAGVNFNSIYESARELLNENLRLVPRERIQRYTVSGGKSTMYFSRYALGRGGQPGGTRTIETEVKPIVGTRIIEAISETNPKPLIEYVVRRKGTDNVKSTIVPNPSNQNRPEMHAEWPFTSYAFNSTYYCDDFVVYGNVKYIPPGYSWAAANNFSSPAYPSDRDLNFDHTLIGMQIPSYDVSEQVPVGYIKLVENQDIKHTIQPVTRRRDFIDAFGQQRSEVINALRIDWVSKTRYGAYNEEMTARATEWKNMLLHPTPQLDNANSLENTGFQYLNGFRYAVQRRLWSVSQSQWLPWETIVDRHSGSTDGVGTYGFDPLASLSGATGTYFAEDRLGYGKTLGVDVEYRIIAKPVVDVNNDKMVLYQRAAFLPVQITWTGQANKVYKIKRRQLRKEGNAVIDETVEVSDPITDRTSYFFIDLPTLCPIRITAGHELEKDQYETNDQILGYDLYEVAGSAQNLLQSWTLSQLRSTTPAAFYVRPDNILPTDFGDLFGVYNGTPLDTTDQPARTTPTEDRVPDCSELKSLVYKVHGSQDGGQSGIRFYAPNYENISEPYGNRTEQTFEVYAGQTFTWDLRSNSVAPNPCLNLPQPCVNPWVPSVFNFYGAEQIWKEGTGEVISPIQAAQRARVFQYGRYITSDCNSLFSIENVAGCQPGHFTGIFKFDTSGTDVISLSDFRAVSQANEAWFHPDLGPVGLPMYATPADVDIDFYGHPAYSATFVPTQWTPWSSAADSAVVGNETLWFMYRTGYERLQLQTFMAPAFETYSVRGVGFITYHGVKYFSGDNITFVPAFGLNYSVSDPTMKLVKVTTIACETLIFDHFQGIAPLKNLSESELEDGVTYRVHKGKGITYQRRDGNGAVPTTVNPGQTFIWHQGDSGITYDVSGTMASQIRAVEGIRHKNQVPKRGWSNEWCMFMSLNHYHPSVSSIWKTDAYGDVMPFLHNRCHTYSAEIRAPWHTTLNQQFCYGQFPPLVSEAPPGYTYLEGINFPYWDDRQVARDYYRSCQVYRQPYEIDSAQIVYTALAGQQDEDGNQKYDDSVVKIVFKGRIQSTRSSPSSVDTLNDGNAGAQAAIRSEPYRTDENALREYLQQQGGGPHCVKGMLGDSATSYNVFTLPDDPMGACHPRFYFVKLIPYAHEDNNTTVESGQDSLIRVDPYVQMDLYLRAMCGGWMDIQSLRSINCDQGLSTSPVADYLYENLCYQACRSYGAHLDVTPEIWSGKNFLPLQTIAEYDFAFAPSIVDPLVMEYRTWQLDKCQWGPWMVYQGTIEPGASEPLVGGTGYQTSPEITLDSGTPTLIKYEKLSTPFVLQANTTYYLMSTETSGGDKWNDRIESVDVNGTNFATVMPNGISNVYAAKYVSGTLTTYTAPEEQNSIFGPVSFRTDCVGCAYGNAITPLGNLGQEKNNISGLIGMRFTTGDTPITVYELGRIVLPNSTQTHTVSIRDGSDITTVLASVAIDATSALTGDAQTDLTLWRAPKFRVNLNAGVITSVDIIDSGTGFNHTKISKMKLYVTASAGSGAVIQVNDVFVDGDDLTPAEGQILELGGIKSVSVLQGGSGYAYPVTVNLIGSFQNNANKSPAFATATVGKLRISRIRVTNGGTGYNSAQVTLIGGGGQGATASAQVQGGTVVGVDLINAGNGYTSLPRVSILGDGTGATAVAEAVIIPGSAGSIASVDLIPDSVGTNFGYSAPPEVQIVGGDTGNNSATGAEAVAKMQVLNLRDDDGMRVVGFEMVPTAYYGLSKISIPYDGPTATKIEFRFSYQADWLGGVPSTSYLNSGPTGVSVLPTTYLSFNFLPDRVNNPHKYEIKRADFTYGTGCNRTPTTWTTLTGNDGVSGPICDNNSNHVEYDDCTTDCACLWPDPTAYSPTPGTYLAPIQDPPQANDVVASTYRIKDLSVISGSGHVTSVGIQTGGENYSAGATVQIVGGGGTGAEATLTISGGVVTGITLTNPGSGYTQDPTVVITDSTGSGASAIAVADSLFQSYFLSWPMQPLVVYNVERRMFYRFDSDETWHTLASGVRSPYIDNAPWEENFSRQIETNPVKHDQVIGTPQEINPPMNNHPRMVTIDLTGVPRGSYKNVYLDCVLTVTVPVDENTTTSVEYTVEPVVVYGGTGQTSFVYEDARVFSQFEGRITKYRYSTRIVTSVSVTWPTLRNHKQLCSDLQRSRLSYKLHRQFETNDNGSIVQVDEVIASSKISGAVAPDFGLNPDSEEITVEWTGWDDDTHRRLDDSRNNTGFNPANRQANTEKYYVVASWVDWPETKCVADAQQNRPDCAPIDDQVPCVNMNRQYRVETVVNARERWFTAMPMAINIERPQGFSPVPNTCTYAEMFNNFARAVNLLTHCRLELPFTKRMRTIYSTSVPDSFWQQPLIDCNNIGCLSHGIRRNVSPEGAVKTVYGDWQEVPVDASVSAYEGVGATGYAVSDCSVDMKMATYRSWTQFAIDPDQEAFSAIPTNLLGNFDISNLALIGKQSQGVGVCRVESGLYQSCLADSCCRNYQRENGWCFCQESADAEPQWGNFCGCGCRLYDGENGPARNNCRVVWETTGDCSVFMAGTVKAPGVPTGDVSWIGGTGYEGRMLCASGSAWSWATIEGIRSLVYMSFPLY